MLPKMKESATTFYGLYLGSVCIVDTSQKNAIKESTRLFVYQDDNAMSATSEVSIDILPDRFRIRSHCGKNNNHNNKLLGGCDGDDDDGGGQPESIIDSGYNLISSCFMLREDNKVVSIVVTNANFTSNLHVLMLTSELSAKRLIGSIYQHFTGHNRLALEEPEPEEIIVTAPSPAIVFPEMFFE